MRHRVRRAAARCGLARLGGRVDGRHPDDARALARGDLDRERVHAADRPVQRQRPERRARRGTARRDDARALGGRRVVRLEREAGQAELRDSGARASRSSIRASGRPARCGRAGRRRRGRVRAPARSAADAPLSHPATLDSARELDQERAAGRRDARLDAELDEQLAGRVHLVDAAHRMRAAPRRRGARGAACRSRAATWSSSQSACAERPPPRPRSRATAAASPFMNTERSELAAQRRRRARPRRPRPASRAGRARRRTPARRGRRRAPACARPRAGTGPSSATSAKRAPASAASSRLSAGPAVFRSA